MLLFYFFRSLTEITAEGMLQAGTLSPRQFEAIVANGGHSSATSIKYYLRRDRLQDVR